MPKSKDTQAGSAALRLRLESSVCLGLRPSNRRIQNARGIATGFPEKWQSTRWGENVEDIAKGVLDYVWGVWIMSGLCLSDIPCHAVQSDIPCHTVLSVTMSRTLQRGSWD